jgi:hypothetical protein
VRVSAPRHRRTHRLHSLRPSVAVTLQFAYALFTLRLRVFLACSRFMFIDLVFTRDEERRAFSHLLAPLQTCPALCIYTY